MGKEKGAKVLLTKARGKGERGKALLTKALLENQGVGRGKEVVTKPRQKGGSD